MQVAKGPVAGRTNDFAELKRQLDVADVDIALVKLPRDEAANRLDVLDINIGPEASIDVHDDVAQQVGLDDFQIVIQGIECSDDIGPAEAFGPAAECLLDIRDGVVVGQQLVSMARVLPCPGSRSVKISVFEMERIDFP